MMEWSNLVVSTVTAILTALVVARGRWKEQDTTAAKEGVAVEQAEVAVEKDRVGVQRDLSELHAKQIESAINQWKAIATERKAQHDKEVSELKVAIQKQEDRISVLLEHNKRCEIESARQKEEIRTLNARHDENVDRIKEVEEQLSKMIALLEAKGIKDATDTHKPVTGTRRRNHHQSEDHE